MNKQDITNLINSNIIDNDNGLITAEAMRGVLNAINDYESPIAEELGRGDNAIAQKTVTDEFDKVNTNIKNLSSNVNSQVQELSDEVEGKVNEIDGKIKGLSDEIDGKIKGFSDEVDSEITKLNQNVQDSLDSYFPINGGTMKGDIDMQGKKINNIGIEEVDKLPTENLYEGRMVRFKNKTYTFYNGLWLALSDDLRGHSNDTHEENFVYQPTASDLSVKDSYAKIKSIKGNTIVWNQWADAAGWMTNINGFNETAYTDGVLKLYANQTGSYNRVGKSENFGFNGHKILLSCKAKCNIDNYTSSITANGFGYRKAISSMDGKYMPLNGMTKSWKIFSGIISFTGDYKTLGIVLATTQEQLDAAGGTLTFEFKDVKAIDLTQMFGAGNEPATVEDFEAMFPASNYEYNAGELLSHDSTGIKTVGFNQWDEEWEKGYINSNGENASSSVQIRSKNYIAVIGGETYYLSSVLKPNTTFGVVFYGKDKDYISGTNVTGTKFTVPNNAKYLRLYSLTAYYGTTYNNDICLNLSHSGYRNGEYQPYEDYVTQWAEGKKISELTSDGVVVFPHGLMSAGDVYDEITKDSAGKSIAIKRCEADTGNLTTAALGTPVTYVLDDDLNLSYKVWDFGTEEILTDELALPFKGDVIYGFNAVDMIRSNFAEIKTLKERVTALEQAILQIQAANTAAEQIIE